MELKDSDIESWIMQGLSVLIFREAIRDAGSVIIDFYKEAFIDKEIRICLEMTTLEKENELRLEVEENMKLKQDIQDLRTELLDKEKLALDSSFSLSKERVQFELASQELSSLREHACRQQTLINEINRDLESLKSQQLEALEQIEVDKMEMQKLKLKLDQANEVLTEVNKERNKSLTLAQKMQNELLLSEVREEKLKKEMELAISELSNFFDDFECRLSWVIRKINLRYNHSVLCL